MSNFVQEACMLNNQGAAFIAAGNMTNARLSFESALQIIHLNILQNLVEQQQMQKQQQQTKQANEKSTIPRHGQDNKQGHHKEEEIEEGSDSTCSALDRHSFLADSGDNRDAEGLSQQQQQRAADVLAEFDHRSVAMYRESYAVLPVLRSHANLYVRDSALLLDESPSTCALVGASSEHGSLDKDPILSLYASVILFNLALIAHNEEYDRYSIPIALAQYQGVIDILGDSCTGTSASSTPATAPRLRIAMMYLMLLALNNQREIYDNDWCDYDSARKCVAAMESIISYLSVPLRGRDLQLAQMSVNIQMQVPPTCAKAA